MVHVEAVARAGTPRPVHPGVRALPLRAHRTASRSYLHTPRFAHSSRATPLGLPRRRRRLR